MKNGNGVSKEEFEALNAEYKLVKSELVSLRDKIDAMQARSQDLQIQNRDLRHQVNSLTKTLDELKTLQKEKDALFATVIHDIKNPAGLIKNLVELLRSYDLTATEQQDIIKDIVDTTQKIVKLSQEVSRVLALEGGRLLLNFETFDINEILRDVFNINTPAADKKNIRFKSELSDKVLEIDADPLKISEVADNLISNAIKFTPDGGAVTVRSKKSGGQIVVEICDTGLGLSEEDIRNAFQQGAQLSAKPTAGENSSGLGLWIVKKLVEAHKGRVWVKSAVGKGSTFYFSIPVIIDDQKDSRKSSIDFFSE